MLPEHFFYEVHNFSLQSCKLARQLENLTFHKRLFVMTVVLFLLPWCKHGSQFVASPEVAKQFFYTIDQLHIFRL